MLKALEESANPMSKKKSKIKKRLLQAAALSLLAGLLVWVFIPNPVPVKADDAHLGSYSALLEADGLTQARDQIVLWMPVSGTPQRMPLQLGDPVVVKQVVARFVPDAAALQDPQTAGYLNARVAAASAARRRAVADREQTAAVVNQARENLRNAESHVAISSTGAAVQRDQAQVAMKLIFKEMDSMDAAAQAAPISGRVLAVAANGKPLVMGASLVAIGNPTDLEVIVETDASAASKVTAGQLVQLQPGQEDALPGRVRRVELMPADAASADIGADIGTRGKTRIAIEFAAPPAKWQALGNHHPLHARITIATIDNVLKVSSKALIKDGQYDAVFVIADGWARKRLVTLSASDAETAVVESGLKENERVILAPGPQIRDGTRVKLIY
jgi:HlyD family secretion protein